MSDSEKDFVKSVINIPKNMLSLLNIYPETNNKFSKFSFILMLLSLFCIETSQIIYMCDHNDITEVASTGTTVSTNFQAICKILIILYYTPNIKEMLLICQKTFWSVFIAAPAVQSSLKWTARLASLNMAGVSICAFGFGVVFLSSPLFANSKQLPFAATLPFDWSKSPIYEITYLWQVVLNIMFVVVPVCGHDFLFIALMVNVISQFRLLKHVLQSVGTNHSFQHHKLKPKQETNDEIPINISTDQELLRICIQHHALLLKFCDTLEKVFSISVLIQYLASISAICVSSFLITLIEKSSVGHLISFCVGHVIQLFMYCAVGNELMFHSQDVATAAFKSKWYMINNNLQKNFILIIQRSQKQTKLSALGFIDLNFESFVKVLKLSFSFNALLNSINEK